MRTNGHRPKGKVNLSNSRIYNAFALTARACQYIFCEQVVRVNQEQSHFGYNKLYTLVIQMPFKRYSNTAQTLFKRCSNK